MDYDNEIVDLKRRVSELEDETSGEKMLSRHIYEKVKDNERVLWDVQADVTGLKTDVSQLKTDMSQLKLDMQRLRQDLPEVVGDALRSVLAEKS